MEKNIYANLDLTKSLSDFQENVTKLLELTDVKEWDGRIIKFREQQIREAALILAGQCIAILLYNLSQSQEARLFSNGSNSGMVAAKNTKARL